jgi:putative SOS response-associated peptidase YedK
MCGRFALTLSPEAIRALLGYVDQPNFPPRTNIAPTQPVAVVHQADGARRFALMRWGFLPGWAKDPKAFPLVFNIRAESAAEKPAFRNALKRRRAIMPADGFYEWRRSGRDSQPFLIRRRDRGPFGFAALWETWASTDGSEIDTVAILTTEANAVTAPIHPRSPVIIDARDFAAWFDENTPPAEAQALLRPPPDDLLEAIPIGRAINAVANDGPEVQAPVDSAAIDDAPARPKPRAAKARPPDDGAQGDLF